MTRQDNEIIRGSGGTLSSRRRFIGRAAAWLGMGAAVPCYVPGHVLGGDHRVGANERIGIGYIGVGRRARQLMGLPAGASIVAVADVDLARAEQIAAKKKCRAYHDYRKLLEDQNVDAVVVATPDHWHVIAAIHACQAGKDVYCEKPLSLTVREGRMLVKAARKYDRIVQTGSQQRSMDANRTACEFVRSGRLGRLKEVIGFNYPTSWECAFPGQDVPTRLDWNRWCGPAPLVPFHSELFRPRGKPGWMSFRPFSGGEMTGWGAHGLDQVQWALGMDGGGPTEIWTEGPSFRPPVYQRPESQTRGDKACSQPTVCFRYAGGLVLKLADGPRGGAVFVGEHGTVTIDRGRYRIEPAGLAGEARAEIKGEPDGTTRHLQNWVDCMRSRRLPVADVEIGHRTATLCHLGNIARWTGRKLKWDPKRELFVGDDAANRLLDRPRRSGFELPTIT